MTQHLIRGEKIIKNLLRYVQKAQLTEETNKCELKLCLFIKVLVLIMSDVSASSFEKICNVSCQTLKLLTTTSNQTWQTQKWMFSVLERHSESNRMSISE